MSTLKDKVALVTGASRGAGKAIALALGSRGATVFVSARSARAEPSPDGAPGTVEDTADEVTAIGGLGIPVVCDHTDDAQVDALFDRISQEWGRLDVLVNNAWAGNDIPISTAPFWQLDAREWFLNMTTGVRAAYMASRAAVPLMLPQQRGLIVTTTFHDRGRFSGNVVYDLAMHAQVRLAWGLSLDLRDSGITSVALSPGFMRTERVLSALGTDESNWSRVPALRGSETPHYVARAVVALALDPEVGRRTGQVLLTGSLAREYGFTDIDGTQPEPYAATLGTRGT